MDCIVINPYVPNIIDASNIELLKKVGKFGMQPTILGEMLVLDIDVSVLDNSNSKKEGVSLTYNKCMEFAQIRNKLRILLNKSSKRCGRNR